MASDRFEFMNLTHLPGRMSTEEAAWFLGFGTHDIQALVSHKLLIPLGKPPKNGVRYFSSTDLERKRRDHSWLNRASLFLVRYWKAKNSRRRPSQDSKDGETEK
jgi:hypothetical protein